MVYDELELKNDGYIIKKDGSILLASPLKFVKRFLKTTDSHYIMDKDTEELFVYTDNVYKKVTISELKSTLLHYMEKKYVNLWKASYEGQYLPAFLNYIPKVTMNSYDNMLVLKNGILDIDNQRLLPHSYQHYSSIKVDFDFAEHATADKFHTFLYDISCGEETLIATLEEVLGYCLTSSVKAGKLVVFLGGGSNGKSTFLSVVKKLVSGQYQSFPLSELEKSFTRHFIRDALVNIISEGDMSSKNVIISDTIKNIITGEDTNGEVKGGKNYTFQPRVKILLATNRLPSSVNSVTFGETRRILLLPFRQRFAGKTDNKFLLEELENELSGILNVALQGYYRLKKQNFVFSYEEQSKKELNMYYAKYMPLEMFVEEYIERNDSSRVYYPDAYKKFQHYCKENNIDSNHTQSTFSRAFSNVVINKYSDVKRCHKNEIRGLKGICLKD